MQLFSYYYKLFRGWGIRKWPSFFKILRFSGLFSVFAQIAKNGILDNKWHIKNHFFCNLVKTNFKVPLMKNYLLANFRLHHFKRLGYRKLANIRQPMQICKPILQKNQKNCFLNKFLGKITSPQTVFPQFPIFDTIWPSLMHNTDCERIVMIS